MKKYYFEDYKNLSWLEIEAIIYYHAGSVPAIHNPVAKFPQYCEPKIHSRETSLPKKTNPLLEIEEIFHFLYRQYDWVILQVLLVKMGCFITPSYTPIVEELNYMDRLINSETPLSKDMRRFISDINTGRIKSKRKGRRGNAARDEKIHRDMDWYINHEDYGVEEAAVKVAETLGLKFGNADSIKKVYSRYEKELNAEGSMLDILKRKGFDIGEMETN